jgi:hypothetical protein
VVRSSQPGWFTLKPSKTPIVEVEKSICVVLPKNVIRGDSDKDTFKKSVIVRNENIQFYWTPLSQDIDKPENSELLLTEIVNFG